MSQSQEHYEKTYNNQIKKIDFPMLRYFNFEPSCKLRWCRTRDLLESQIPVITGGFELRISCIQIRYLTH